MKLFKSTNRKVSFSNYVIMLSIVIVLVFGVFLLRNIYLTREDNKLNELVLEDVLTNKLMINEVYNYIDENPDTIMYVGVGRDEVSRKFEKSIKKYIVKNELNNEIIYLNLFEEEVSDFFSDFNKKYKFSENIEFYPLVISFKDGEVNKVLQRDISKENFVKFIIEVRNEEND